MKRAVIIVLDSVGCGTCPDSHLYGDHGANTLNHIARDYPGLELPALRRLGLGNLEDLEHIKPQPQPAAAYGRMQELSAGKDTTTGHWELSGIVLDKPFPTFPQGFPEELISRFTSETGLEVLGNKVASGTTIIRELGDEHIRTGKPIVYTSADSVFQIAAHEKIIPLEDLYGICQKARKLLRNEYAVGRVIARPFTGDSGNYVRTADRHDFSLEPVGETLLDRLSGAGYEVRAIGKIHDIFAGRGTTWHQSTKNNSDGVRLTIEQLNKSFSGLLFVNLVDFDMHYGHRNDVDGYARALMEFDNNLPAILSNLQKDDVLLITADHGCDPTFPGTDHTREYVPLLITGNPVKKPSNLGTLKGFGTVASTIAEYLGLQHEDFGHSILEQIT